jgi:hypothetical protein
MLVFVEFYELVLELDFYDEGLAADVDWAEPNVTPRPWKA